MADMDKCSGSRKRNVDGEGDGDGDDRSRNRNRKGRSLLEYFDSDFEVEEKASSDVENNNNSLIKILVKTATGKIILLVVKGSDTIGSIKLKIQAEESIPFDEQELIFNGMVLEDINTIDSMQIKNSTLTLVRKSSGFMSIFINFLQGKRMYCLEAKPTYTIADVKDKIKIKEGIRVDEQVLIFNKMILGDGGTLFDFHIHAKSILTLMHKSRGFMQILIKTPTEETITLKVKPSYTIYSIKRKIKDQVHIPCDEQELSFNETVLRNINTLSDFNINKGSTLTLTRISSGFMQIFIKNLTGTTFTLDVQRLDTIKSIKTKIQDNVDIHKVNIPRDEQELIFNEMVLHDKDTLADYNIKRNSTLTLVPISRGVMQIFIKICSTGKTITLEVKPSDTIHDVKTKIFDKQGYSTCDQKLVFNKRLLADGPILADYHIHKESTVHLFTRS